MQYVKYGNTDLKASRVALGGASYGIVNYAADWNPYIAEGRAKAIDTVRYALERGVNYIDTAPSYGLERQSEKLMGEALEGRRDKVILASKVGSNSKDKATVLRSVEESLRALKTDYLDIIQLHGGAYEDGQIDCLLNEGPVEALLELKQKGVVRNVGFTTELAFSARRLLASGLFDMLQVTYNITNITASHYILDQALEKGIGVTAMRPLASGMFAQLMEYLEPEMPADKVNSLALRFLLSDTRVHVVNIGMRSRAEVDSNLNLVESYGPNFDMATFPRLIMTLYKMQDTKDGKPWREDENYIQG